MDQPTPIRKILIRAPNWLGDLVISTGFFHRLEEVFPEARRYVILTDGLAGLAPLIGTFTEVFPLPRQAKGSLLAMIGFARQIKGDYDLFFTLPDSFASALLGRFTGSVRRIGFAKELRSPLLTRAYRKPGGVHRVEEYAELLRDFHQGTTRPLDVSLRGVVPAPLDRQGRARAVVLNINSEAQSRRMSIARWAKIGRGLQAELDCLVVLTGAPHERERPAALAAALSAGGPVLDLSGRTAIDELPGVMKTADLVVTSDSGPAHVANAVGTPTVVLFGAGDESNSAPYNPAGRKIIRLEELPCAPCRANTCRLGVPICLEHLEPGRIVAEGLSLLRLGRN